MRKSTASWLPAIAAALLFGTACSSRNSSFFDASQLDAEIPRLLHHPLTEARQRESEALHSFLVGQIQYDRQEYSDSLANFSRASKLLDSPMPFLNARLAELYLRAGNLEGALKESEAALQVEPSNDEVLLLRAGVLDAMQRFDEAELLYMAIVERSPDRLEPRLLLSTHYLKQNKPAQVIATLQPVQEAFNDQALLHYYLGKAFEQIPNLPRAEESFKRAVALEPANTDMMIELARVLAKRRNFAGVKAICAKILERDPSHKIARRVLGDILLGEENFEEALPHLQALEASEDDPTDTRYKIALVQLRRRRTEEAIRELNLVLADKPDHAEARYNLASALASSGQVDQAVEELYKIDDSSELFAKSRTFAAFLLRQSGNLVRAEEAIRESLDAEANNPQLLSFLVVVLRDLKKNEEARAVLERMLEQEPQNERVLVHYALVLHDLRDKESATKTMEQVIKYNPKNADALNYVAYSLAERGVELSRALDYVKRALEIRPNDGYYLDTLGYIYLRQGAADMAVPLLEKAANSTGEDPEILEHYGDSLVAVGRNAEARSIYERALAAISQTNDEARLRLQNKLEALPSDVR